jgi:hypothetical protein
MEDQTVTISDAATLAGYSGRVQNHALDKVREGKAKTLNRAVNQDGNGAVTGGKNQRQDKEPTPAELANAPKLFRNVRELLGRVVTLMARVSRIHPDQDKKDRVRRRLDEADAIFEQWHQDHQASLQERYGSAGRGGRQDQAAPASEPPWPVLDDQE